MDMMLKTWAWLNGKKTAIGAAFMLVALVLEQLPELVGAFGGDTAAVAKVTGVILTVVGLLHKGVKNL